MRITLRECEEVAKEKGFDSMEFMMVMKSGVKHRARWLDAYFGMMTFPEIDDLKDNFVMTGQIEYDVEYCLLLDQEL